MENILIATARQRNYRGSARKARLVLDMIRGKSVVEARNILNFTNKKMAEKIVKILDSAVANLVQIHGKIDNKNMRISKATADGAQTRRGFMPRARGSASIIRKRSCHITIEVLGSK